MIWAGKVKVVGSSQREPYTKLTQMAKGVAPCYKGLHTWEDGSDPNSMVLHVLQGGMTGHSTSYLCLLNARCLPSQSTATCKIMNSDSCTP